MTLLQELQSDQDVRPAHTLAVRQRLHFVLCVVLPSVVTLAGPILWPEVVRSREGIVIFVVMWALAGGVGISVGFHRLFTHRAFVAAPIAREVLGALGSMSAQGPLIYWVSLHRRHHARSDGPGDPHTPNALTADRRSRVSAFLHGHMGWAWSHDVPRAGRFAPDLVSDPQARRISSSYWWWVAVGLLVPAAVGGIASASWTGVGVGFYWGGAVRIAVVHQIIWCVNSICHRWGSRPYSVGDNSTNLALLALPTFGESWHNNHHHRPASPRFGDKWWQIDLGWWVIRMQGWVGAAPSIRPSSRSAK